MTSQPLWQTGGEFQFKGLLASADPIGQALDAEGYATAPTADAGDSRFSPRELTPEAQARSNARAKQVQDFMHGGWGTVAKVGATALGFAVGGPVGAVTANTMAGLLSARNNEEALGALGVGAAGITGGPVAQAANFARSAYTASQQWQQGRPASAVATGALAAAGLAGYSLSSDPLGNFAVNAGIKAGAGMIDGANDDTGGWGHDSGLEQHGPTRGDGSFGSDGSGRGYGSGEREQHGPTRGDGSFGSDGSGRDYGDAAGTGNEDDNAVE